MVIKALIILVFLSWGCLGLPSPEDSVGRAAKAVCVDSLGEGRCVPTYLCKPDEQGHVEIRHPITPPCPHYYHLCCPTERVIEWMPPPQVP